MFLKNRFYLGVTILVGVCMADLVLVIATAASEVRANSVDMDSLSATYTHTLFLPMVAKQSSCDFSGYATLNGVPASVTLGLLQRQYIDSPTIYTTTTDSNGWFCFQDVPILSSCDADYGYSVYFGNGLEVPSQEYAAGWMTALLTRCTASQVYTNIKAELSDITILTPPDDITVTLPVTFSWKHPAVTNASYYIFVGNCSPVNVGYATTYVFNQEGCEKPWLPTHWHILEYADGIRYSQEHSLMIER